MLATKDPVDDVRGDELHRALRRRSGVCLVATVHSKSQILPLWNTLNDVAGGDLVMLNAATYEDCAKMVAEGTANLLIALATPENLRTIQAHGLRPFATTSATRLSGHHPTGIAIRDRTS